MEKPAPEEEEARKLVFKEIMEICLWGNATDLSLLTTLSYDDIQKLQGKEARRESEGNILANDLDAVWDTITRNQKGRVDIVLDNAGFELYVDLVLAGYLLSQGLATEVVLHPKNIPWFVSDVMPADFGHLLNALHDSASFFGAHHNSLEKLFQHWSSLHADGKLRIQTSNFWTGPTDYRSMSSTSSGREVLSELKKAEWVVFKGDLNYRKLTGDLAWDPTVAFGDAIGELGGRSGVRVLALRTCKADVVVGLGKGVDERLRGEQGGDGGRREWAWTGKWAVVQAWDGKKGE